MDLYDAVVEALQKDKIGRVRIGRGVCENENPIFLQCQPWPAVPVAIRRLRLEFRAQLDYSTNAE
jgi:hypothetical protein